MARANGQYKGGTGGVALGRANGEMSRQIVLNSDALMHALACFTLSANSPDNAPGARTGQYCPGLCYAAQHITRTARMVVAKPEMMHQPATVPTTPDSKNIKPAD